MNEASVNNDNLTDSAENIENIGKKDINSEDINFSLSRGFAYETAERRKKRNMLVLLFFCVILAVTCIVLAVLFSYAANEQNRICSEKYIESAVHINSLIDGIQADDFDDETKYREIIGELGSARQLMFLTKKTAEQKNTINSLYFSSIKLPKQFMIKISDIQRAFSFIVSGNDEQGYSLLNTVIAELDKLDY